MRSRRAVASGFFVAGFVAAIGVSLGWAALTDPEPLEPPDTCHGVENLDLPVSLLPGIDPLVDADVVIDPPKSAGDVCAEIDEQMARRLDEVPDGFLAVKAAQQQMAPPSIQLVWSDDGCSFAPVRNGGPFGFLGACKRHDFAWRNLRRLDRDGARVWNAVTKSRADLGFLNDMRITCSQHNVVARPFCEASARSFYLAVHLYTPGTQGVTDLIPADG